jgi:hypothetical protein
MSDRYARLDTLRRADLGEWRGAADALDDWLLREHGRTSGRHCLGHLLDLLAEEGYVVLPLEQVTYQYGYGTTADDVQWYPGEPAEWVRKVSDPLRGERVYCRPVGAPEVTPDA